MEQYEVREYLTEAGCSPFSEWVAAVRDVRARARIRTRIDRLSLGNLGDYSSVGEGVFELRVFHGPGYRVYFAFEEQRVVLLLCGGVKNTQQRDIRRAREYWNDFRRRSNGGKDK